MKNLLYFPISFILGWITGYILSVLFDKPTEIDEEPRKYYTIK